MKCVDVSTVRRWVRRIKDGELGQADLSDKRRSGRAVTASGQLHQDRVEEMIRGNIRIKQTKIAVALGISKERVGHITCVLGFRNFVPDGYRACCLMKCKLKEFAFLGNF